MRTLAICLPLSIRYLSPPCSIMVLDSLDPYVYIQYDLMCIKKLPFYFVSRTIVAIPKSNDTDTSSEDVKAIIMNDI